jgi:Flp pilus assembly protein TadD
VTRLLVLTLALVVLDGCATVRRADARNDFEEGVTLFNQGRFEAAIPYFEAATRHDPNFSQAYL